MPGGAVLVDQPLAGGAVQKTRGMDYFNMPQTRSFVFTVNLNR